MNIFFIFDEIYTFYVLKPIQYKIKSEKLIMRISDFISSKKEEQDKFFFDNIQIRNHKEGKLILVKYDSEHLLRDIVMKYEDNKEILLKELNNFYNKRKDFIEFMIKYI
jgi:hypothetical protein